MNMKDDMTLTDYIDYLLEKVEALEQKVKVSNKSKINYLTFAEKLVELENNYECMKESNSDNLTTINELYLKLRERIEALEQDTKVYVSRGELIGQLGEQQTDWQSQITKLKQKVEKNIGSENVALHEFRKDLSELKEEIWKRAYSRTVEINLKELKERFEAAASLIGDNDQRSELNKEVLRDLIERLIHENDIYLLLRKLEGEKSDEVKGEKGFGVRGANKTSEDSKPSEPKTWKGEKPLVYANEKRGDFERGNIFGVPKLKFEEDDYPNYNEKNPIIVQPKGKAPEDSEHSKAELKIMIEDSRDRIDYHWEELSELKENIIKWLGTNRDDIFKNRKVLRDFLEEVQRCNDIDDLKYISHILLEKLGGEIEGSASHTQPHSDENKVKAIANQSDDSKPSEPKHCGTCNRFNGYIDSGKTILCEYSKGCTPPDYPYWIPKEPTDSEPLIKYEDENIVFGKIGNMYITREKAPTDRPNTPYCWFDSKQDFKFFKKIERNKQISEFLRILRQLQAEYQRGFPKWQDIQDYINIYEARLKE